MDLQILTSQSPKTPIAIFVDSITTRLLNVTTFLINTLTVIGNAWIQGNLEVDGYSNSQTINAGNIFLTAANTTVGTPAGTGGSIFAYNPTLGKVTFSGLAGVGTCMDTTDGATFNALATPIGDLQIQYSPSLGYYSAQQLGGTAVYTSPDATSGSFVLRAPVTTAFSNDSTVVWIGALNRFFTCSADPFNIYYSSLDGINWTLSPGTRRAYEFVYSSSLGILVSVGPLGPAWSSDGLSWTNSSQTYEMSDCCWSDYWQMFVATPRTFNLDSVYTSLDGKTWTLNTGVFPGLATSLRCITWSQDYEVFVAAGDSDVMWISQDGLRWRQMNLVPAGLSMYGVEFIPQWGELIAIGNTNIARISARPYV